MKKKYFFLFLLIFQLGVNAQKNVRERIDFNKDWFFSLTESAISEMPASTNVNWRKLNLPHDWSIEGKFDEHSPATTGGAALNGGLGWYCKSFSLPVSEKGKQISIDFDGVYRNSEVFINGHSLGIRPNGFISFRYNLTPFLKFGSEKNIIAVKVDNSQQPNSRWYSGSGIYRNVWLVKTAAIAVDQWGTFLTTPTITKDQASVNLSIKIASKYPSAKKIAVFTYVLDAAGTIVASNITANTSIKSELILSQALVVKKPILWNLEKPYLYQAITTIKLDGQVVDAYETSFGIRSFEFNINKGFLLNGKQVKINGVCNHHDLGCLGSAINYRGLERQLEILKAMGCNGIRTSHNPPAPELLELCDKMGFVVMDEAFDMWKRPKNKFDYHLDWDQWHEKDLVDQIKRDRNHPSIFMWSIGNEISEQGWGLKDTSGRVIGRELTAIVKSLDTTRVVTCAFDNTSSQNNIILSGAIDVYGYNYHHREYAGFQQKFPGKPFIGSETVSALQTRGYYEMPSDSIRRWPANNDPRFKAGSTNLNASAYDNVSASWGSTHEETWKQIKKNDFIAGQFIWTGFDYLGEPTPYPWPARSSYFGIVDLAGFPKDVYYMYQSEWTNKPVLHLLPHWNWKMGETIDVWAYYNQADEVELFLNNQSLGIRKKTGDDLHVQWRVPFQPGVLKAVSRLKGKTVLITEKKTATKPAKLLVSADRNLIKANGKDLSYITVTVVDAAGVMVPDADQLIEFTVNGAADIIATDNGSPTSLVSFKSSSRQAFNGLCLAVVQSKMQKGKLVITAKSAGLPDASIAIDMQ